jgi:ATP-dependent Clp protease ATP-binding subunit ClpC
MTSNVGSDTIKKQSTMGFSPITDEGSYEKMRERILEEARKTFRPEFLNRLDDLIVFRSFTKPDLIQILGLEVEKVLERLRHKNLKLELDEKAKDFLVEKGYDPQYGARPMRRSVERFFEDPLAEEILKGNLHEGDPILVTVEKDKLVFNQNAAAAAEGALSS